MGRHNENRERQGYDARRRGDGRSGRGNDHHRTILERIEEKLSRLLGSDDDQDRIPPEAFVYDEEAGEPRILGGPHASAKLIFLPPYSPDLNPIEQIFAKLKLLLRKAAERSVEATWKRIGALLDTFPPHERANYLRNAGYASI